MPKSSTNRMLWIWVAFIFFFCLFVLVGWMVSEATPANAAPPEHPKNQTGSYAGSESCTKCHENIHDVWMDTRHAQAFSSPIFQRDWKEASELSSCLECHTTGYDPATGEYNEEGVACEACHGAFQPNHPTQSMSVKPDAELCARCHSNTTNEWKASTHSQEGIQCESCHNPHSQTPKADTVTGLCSNCHKERGDSFTHGTHANAGLECSNCHMYTPPREGDPIMGLVPTGHTFAVGSDACVGCHQDTVHTRDELIKLGGGEGDIEEPTVEDLQQTVFSQEQSITSLQAQSGARLYSGLIQGAIIGLVTGGVAAWVVSRRIQVVEEEDEDHGEEEES